MEEFMNERLGNTRS